MEHFDTNLASLTYLTNPLYQQILKQQKELKESSNKSDVKFYRKRITSLTKDMLKGEMPDNSYVKTIYETYVNGLIKYFKILDTSDIIQKQYSSGLSDISIDEDLGNNVTEVNTIDNINNVKEVNISELMMRKYSKENTLDNFVIKKQPETTETRIIPVIIEVDLKEESLKMKGVKEKTEKKQKMKCKLNTILEEVIVKE